MVYALQKVQIRNTMPLEEAKKHYKNITKRNPRKIRETKQFYQFRFHPPTRFESKSFRTKVVNKDIHLIYGKLKPEFGHLEGSGLFDYFKQGYDYVKNKVKDIFTINDYSDKTKEYLEKYGELPIVAIQLRRVPVSGTLELALQGLSAGEWERLKAREGFDKMFHLSMIVTLRQTREITMNNGKKRTVGSGKKLAVEKLAVISVNERIEMGEGMETQEVALDGKSFTIKHMLQTTRDRLGDEKFFAYSALGANNCQDFISNLLTSEGLLDERARLFLYQDVSALARDLPEFTKSVSQGLTDIAAVANKYFGIGSGKKTLDNVREVDDVESFYQFMLKEGGEVTYELFMKWKKK